MKTLVKILSAPFLGLLFFLALPIISVGLIAYTLGEKIYSGLKLVGGRMLYFAWRPSEAYLSGKSKEIKRSK